MNLLLIIDRIYPTDHAFLETVYTTLLPGMGYTIHCIARTMDKPHRSTEQWNQIPVHLFNIHRKPYFLWRIIRNWEIFFYTIYLCKKHHIRIIQVRNWEIGAAVAVLMRVFFPVIFFYQRSFPLELNYREKLHSGKTPFREKISNAWLLFLYKLTITKADVIFAISEEMKNRMEREGLHADRIIPIGLAYDDRVVTDSAFQEKLVKEYHLEGKKVLIYFGKMDPKRNLEFLLDVFDRIPGENLKLLLAGGTGADILRLQRYSDSLNLTGRVIFAGRVDRNHIPDYLAISYISLSPIPPLERYLVASPTKLFESMGQGIPVIGNDLPVQKQILDDSQGGICVPYEVNAFVHAIVKLLNSPDARDQMAVNGRDYILKNCTYELLAHRLDRIYQEYTADSS